ncbi:MAG: hypothetical protein KF800_00940 [Lysobacter sp.]|nr:hypothetical protein [Lysobacter sp.]
MFRSTLQLTRQLSDALLQFPALVRLFECKSTQALPQLLAWIDATEGTLSGHRLVAAADVAGYKSRVLAPMFDDDRRGTLRRRQLAAAAALLHDLQQSVQSALQPHASKVEQARGIARHLLQIVAQSGAVPWDPAVSYEDMVERIWRFCTGHDQLKPVAAQLKTLLPASDIRLLLGEEIDPMDFVQAA